MAYVDPNTVQNATAGQVLQAARLDADRDALEYLARNKPHAKATRTSTQSIGNDAWTAISFTSEDFDVGGCHSTASNQSRFTVPTGEAGKYEFVADVKFAANATGDRFLRIVRNGTDEIAHTTGNASGSVLAYMNCSTGPVIMAAGDYVEAYVFQNSGGNLNTAVSDGNSYLTGIWVAL